MGSVEGGVDFEVLRRRVLDEVKHSDGDKEDGKNELKEPIQIQGYSRDMHLHLPRVDRRFLNDPRPSHR